MHLVGTRRLAVLLALFAAGLDGACNSSGSRRGADGGAGTGGGVGSGQAGAGGRGGTGGAGGLGGTGGGTVPDAAIDAANDVGDAPNADATDAPTDVPACTPAPTDMVAWWAGDGDASDRAGASEGTLQGGASFAAGRIAQAFSFNGTDAFVQVTPTAALDFGAGDFTVSLWVNLTSLDGEQTFLQKLSGTTTQDPSYFIEFYAPNNLRFATLETATNRNDLAVTAALVVSRWYHLAGVRSGNASTLYLDGVSIGTQTAGTGVNTGTGGNLRIGRTAHDTAGISRFVNGLVDEVKLFNRALSAAEIAAMARGASGGSCE